MTTDGTVKLLDLGIASQRNPIGNATLTSNNQILGTIDYMAPEQVFDSRSSDVRSDIYSLGFTFFQLLSGFPPYSDLESKNVFRKAVAHSTQTIPSIRDCRTDVSKSLESILLKMCKKDPNQRFQSAEALVEAVTKHSEDSQLVRLVEYAQVATKANELPLVTSPFRSRSRRALKSFNLLLSAMLSIATVSILVLAVQQTLKSKVPVRSNSESKSPEQNFRFPLPRPGTYSGQNRNSSNRVDPAYTILSEDVFCYGQQPPSRKIGGTWVRDRSHPIEGMGYYVYRQWPSSGSIVVIVSYDGERFHAPYFNGSNLESLDLLQDPTIAESYGEFSGKWVSEDCYVDGTYDRGFKSDVHESWKTTLREFAPSMLLRPQ